MSEDRLKRGDAVADYVIQRHLGAGGFADVYLAHHATTGAAVALKVLSRASTDDPSTRARVQREAEITAGIRHPRIVPLLDHGMTGDARLFLVFEYAPGEDLSARLERTDGLPAAVVREMLAQLLEALDAAHRAGVIHRDIKPENIRVLDHAHGVHVRLFDFGIARATAAGSPSVTATGELIGTPRYMSPEQLTGKPLDARSDIYSVGMVAIEMLLGRGALQGGAWGDQLERLQSGYLFAVEGPDADLVHIIGRMTARRPEDRFGSARAVLVALKGDAPIDVDPGVDRPRRSFLAAGVLALVVLGGLVVVGKTRREPAPDAPGTSLDQLAALNSSTPRPKPETVSPAAHAAKDAGEFQPCTTPSSNLIAVAPCRYDPEVRYPLVVIFRDFENDPASVFKRLADGPPVEADLLRKGGFIEVADAHDVIFVAVEGGMTHWGGDGIDAVSQLLEQIAGARRVFNIDPARIFVLGLGHGGGPAYDAACEPEVAGVATFAHHMKHRVPCTKAHKPALLLFPNANPHHPRDGERACEGDQRPRSLAELQELWADKNDCTGPGEARSTADPTVSCRQWSCARDSVLSVCELPGGRPWPGMTSNDGPCSSAAPTANLALVTWEFFASLKPRAGLESDAR